MRFTLENGMEQFNYQDAQLLACSLGEHILMELAAPVAKATNPQNDSMEDRYVESLQIRLMNAKIVEFVKEGYRYYDANNVLQETVADTPIASLEWDSQIADLVAAQAIVFQIEPIACEQGLKYRFYFDVADSTYLLTIACSKTIHEWERFQNRFMS
jgi:hypothetical protein